VAVNEQQGLPKVHHAKAHHLSDLVIRRKVRSLVDVLVAKEKEIGVAYLLHKIGVVVATSQSLGGGLVGTHLQQRHARQFEVLLDGVVLDSLLPRLVDFRVLLTAVKELLSGILLALCMLL
jgi:hypothetical protein